jgi:Glycosyltransferase family 87
MISRDRATGTSPARRLVTAETIGLVLALAGGAVLVGALIAFQGSRGSAFDFAAYDAAARRLAAGQPLYQAVTQQGPFAPGPAGIYLYPPPLAVLLLAFVPLSGAAAAIAWQALHVVALVAACAILPVPRWVRLASFGVACLSVPTLLDLNLGNVSLFVLLAGAASWRWTVASSGGAAEHAASVSRRSGRTRIPLSREPGPLAAGVLAALAIAVRPQVAVVFAWWAWRRSRDTGAAMLGALAAGCALLVGSALVAGAGSWTSYVRLLGNLRGAGTASSDVGLASLAQRAGLPDPIPTLLFATGALLALAAVVVASRRDQASGLVAAVTATLLVVPLLWPHYLVLLVLPGALLAARGRAWGLALPLLAWLPGPILPLLALAGCWAPVVTTVRAGSTGGPPR